MIYAILLLVFALVVAPIFWIMPKPSEKRQTAFRTRAMSLGLQIRVTPMPQTHRAEVRKEDVVQGALYKLEWRVKAMPMVKSCLGLRVEEGIEWRAEGDETIQSLLADALTNTELPIRALECNQAGVGAYWREGGDIANVDGVNQLLTELRAEILSRLGVSQ